VVVAVGLLSPFLVLAHPAAADQIANKQAQAAKLARQIDQLSLRVSQLSEKYDEARLRVDQVNASLAAAKTAMDATNSQLSSASQRVRDLAVSSYMEGGQITNLGLLVPKSADELANRAAYVQSVAGTTNEAIDALHQDRALLAQEQSALSAAQASAASALAAAGADQRAAAAADASERATLAGVQGQLAQLVAAAQAQQQAALATRLQAVASRQSLGGGGASGSGLGGIVPGSLPPPGAGAGSAVAWARAELGKPYLYGGAGPNAFDCSGLTAWAWGHAGVPLPHSAAAQYDVTTHIPISALQPGDLVFYGSPPHHVGIYVGGGR
jgi:cell wall-associated NlpC family hydrolase